ncbi:MAG TPA: hypothetical protein VF318_05825 [Dehalococcoidales bacterium]
MASENESRAETTVNVKKNSLNPIWKKLTRLSAWALLAGVIILLLSGWGITQTGVIHRITFGLVDRRLADAIHRDTNGPLAFLFLAHVLINIKINIYQKFPAWNWLTNSVAALVGAASMAAVIYLEYFRRGG